MKTIALTTIVLLAAVLVAGCNDDSDRAQRYGERLTTKYGYADVKPAGRGYIHYTIENGTVTCREHARRSELTCWKN